MSTSTRRIRGVDREGAIELLTPHLLFLEQCASQGLQLLNGVLNHYPQSYYQRTKATLLHNMVVNEIKNSPHFSSNIDVAFHERFETLYVVIGNQISIRFKKLNEMGMAANISTARNDSIMSQQLSFEFSEYPNLIWVDFGYRIDKSWTSFESLEIVCRRNDQTIWTIPISITEKNENVITSDTIVEPSLKITVRKKKAQ